MPFNEDFTLRVMVGSTVLPEYQRDGMCYIESNLFTPYSYNQMSTQVVQDEIERQSWPVTPFTISIEAKPSAPCCYYRVYVDGRKVKSVSVPPGQTRVIKGFRDRYCVKEFLFSLPRFAENETDRLETENVSRVGLVEVECFNATHRSSKPTVRLRKLEFDQANKKDCTRVTGGQYLMATTKTGRIIEQKPAIKMTDYWNIHSMRNKLAVKYVTAQTITDMNLDVIPIPFPQSVSPTHSPVPPEIKTPPAQLARTQIRSGSPHQETSSDTKKFKMDLETAEAAAALTILSNHTAGASPEDAIVLD